MYTQFAPMTSSTVQFAKDYRNEQIRAAEHYHLASQFRSHRVRRATRTMFVRLTHLRHSQRPTTQLPTARPAH